MSKSKILYLFTRTPLHVGAGSSVGAIDQPIQRERHTGFPIIPGSSVKGVLRDHLRTLGETAINDLFGKGDEKEDFTAGKISFGEARLLAFPVRSLAGWGHVPIVLGAWSTTVIAALAVLLWSRRA